MTQTEHKTRYIKSKLRLYNLKTNNIIMVKCKKNYYYY